MSHRSRSRLHASLDFFHHLRLITTWLAAALLVAVFAACGGTSEPTPGEPTPGEPTPGEPQDVHVRQEINSLSAEQIDAYRKGVALMQQRDVSDPTSWLYQANIHGFPGNAGACPATAGPPLEAWATCQHGNFFFLSWHRMYLYYFERILRAAVREATGDPEYDFALPYWDYEDASNHDLPEPFRNPADTSNSLYVAQRAPNCNAGEECVSEQEADAEVALSLLPFCNCPSGQDCPGCTANLFPDEAFGSQFTAVPQHSSGNFGELESQPHNVVHVAVGGNFGWMSYVTCAARDPIFWLHHANIDRLWQVWLNQGNRMNPLGADNWKNHKFVFFDENKTKVEMTGCEILNMATQLDYEYKGVPVENVVLCDDTEGQGIGTPGAPPEEPQTLVAGEPATHELGNEPTKVSVDVPADAGQEMLAIAAGESEENKQLRVVVEGLKLVHPGAHYQVYLNLPAGQEPDPKSVYFLGHIAIFGEVHEGDPGGSRSFDITEKVRELKQRDEWQGKVELSFVRGNPESTEGIAPGTEAPDVFMRFSHISVVER